MNRDLNRQGAGAPTAAAAIARACGGGDLAIKGSPNGTGSLHQGFNAFWELYPKKVAKQAAWKAWQKRQPDQALTERIVAALTWQRQQDQWLRESGRFVPYPAKWINGGQWDDEPSATSRLNDRTIALARAGEEFLKS